MGLSKAIQSRFVLVAYGYNMQAHGMSVWQNPKFPPLDMKAHRPGSAHYDGDAIDVYTTSNSKMHRDYANFGRPKANAVGLSLTSNYYGTPDCGDHESHWHVDVDSYSDEGRGVFATHKQKYDDITPLLMERRVSLKNKNLIDIVQRITGVKVDTIYGDKTRAAVSHLQSELKVHRDEVFGPDTAEAYLKSQPPVKKGSKGDAVRLVQFIVGCDIDGVAGNATEGAIKLYQWASRIKDDGVFGDASAHHITR